MSGRRAGRLLASARGAAAVEFALVLPLLLVLLLGTIDWGWYFFLREVVTTAAREGARAGAVSAASPLEAATGVARNYLRNAGLNAAEPLASLTTASVAGTVVTTVSVSITYPAGSITGFTFLGTASLVPAEIQAQSQMRREGT